MPKKKRAAAPDVLEPLPDGSIPEGYLLCADGKLYRQRIEEGVLKIVGSTMPERPPPGPGEEPEGDFHGSVRGRPTITDAAVIEQMREAQENRKSAPREGARQKHAYQAPEIAARNRLIVADAAKLASENDYETEKDLYEALARKHMTPSQKRPLGVRRIQQILAAKKI